jgi:hypothetical protein
VPEAVITVVRAADDGCQHLKHVDLPTEIQGLAEKPDDF